jgi:hypothetical protein
MIVHQLNSRLCERYDLLFLADLLWYTSAHGVLLDSIVTLLSSDGKAWIGCGKYTTLETCNSFIALAGKRGLKARRIELDEEWKGQKSSLTNLKERKSNVWLWEMVWR